MQLSILMLCFCFSKAQHPAFYSLNDENGLPSNEIYQCLQDMNGFIWIGCDAGLFRYDGFEYKKYTCGRQNGRSISGLQTDVSGRIWCRNFAGQVYRVDADSLMLITDLSTARNNNSQYALDDKGNAWIVKDQELQQFDGWGNLLFVRNLFPDSNSRFIFLDIAFYQNRLFISGAGQVPLIFDVSNRSMLQAGNNLLMDKKRAWSFYQLQNRLFILLQHPAIAECSIYEWKDNDFILQNSFIKTRANNRIFNLRVDRQNRFWLCTANGLIPYHFNLKTLDDTTPLFKANNISNLLHDKEGTYWITTLQNGINIIPSMEVIRYDAQHSGLNESNITTVAAGATKVAMGTFSGSINLLDKQKLDIKSVKEIPRAISIKRLRFFQDDLYVAHGMISVLKQGKFVRKSLDINIRDFSFTGDSLIYISPEVHGKLKVSDLTGFNTRVTAGGRAVAYCKKRAIAYYALNSGLVLEKNGKIIPVEGRLKNPLYVTSLAVSRDKVYAATLNEGLVEMDGAVITRTLNAANSSLHNQLRFVHANNDFIWVCDDSSLFRINTSAWTADRFLVLQGINAQDITDIDTDSADIYLATNKGLIVFPQSIGSGIESKPFIKIENVESDGVLYRHDRFFKLPYNHKNLTIRLVSVALRSRGHYFYHFRIPELDSNWQQMHAGSRKVQYQALPPGKYSFQVKAINESGKESEVIAFHFMVKAPLWQQWWLYLLVTFLCIAAATFFFRQRLKRIKHQADLKNRLAASQLVSLKSRMNPHFMHNALNSIQALILKEDTYNANRYLAKFSKLMRMVLDVSGKQFITLEEELQLLNLYIELEKLRFGDDFTYQVTVDETIDTRHCLIPAMIIQPFIENAVKHGLLHKRGIKYLQIDFSLAETLVCRITDNGIGRKKAAEIRNRQQEKFKSFATGATEKQLELLNIQNPGRYKITIRDLYDSGIPSGTEVCISMPY